jgi:hypothetical protein
MIVYDFFGDADRVLKRQTKSAPSRKMARFVMDIFRE